MWMVTVAQSFEIAFNYFDVKKFVRSNSIRYNQGQCFSLVTTQQI